MLNIFFNTAINSNHLSLLGKCANHSFASVRYIFHGRTIELWDRYVIEEEKSFSESHWTKTAAAILLFIPGIFLGTIAKLLDCAFYASSRADLAAIQEFDQNPYSLDENISLEFSHIKLSKMGDLLKDKMTSKEVWKKPAFIKEVSTFMEAAYKEIERLFEQLEEKYGKVPETVAKALAGNGLSHIQEQDDSLYCYYYFYNSLTEIYHLARGCASLKTHPDLKWKVIDFPLLKDADRNPYFNSDTPQYHWRTLYNNFCNKIDEFEGLREKLNKEDRRFINWAQPDEELDVDTYPFPDTRPTIPSSFFDKR